MSNIKTEGKFFFLNSEEANEYRPIFKEVFSYNNIAKMVPTFKKITKKHIQRIKDKVVANGSAIVNYRDDFNIPLFNDISTYIMFGSETQLSGTVLMKLSLGDISKPRKEKRTWIGLIGSTSQLQNLRQECGLAVASLSRIGLADSKPVICQILKP